MPGPATTQPAATFPTTGDVNQMRNAMRVERARRLAQLLPGSGGSTWRGLALRPQRVHFATQNEGEEVLIFLRRHWLTNINWIFNMVLYLIAPVVLTVILNAIRIDYIDIFGWKILTILVLAYYSIVLTSALGHFLDWYYNLYIVTNERIIDYDFALFRSVTVSEVAIEGVEKVIESEKGFFGTLFGYGDVTAYGEADKVNITFNDAPNPTLVRDKISDLADAIRETRYGI